MTEGRVTLFSNLLYSSCAGIPVQAMPPPWSLYLASQAPGSHSASPLTWFPLLALLFFSNGATTPSVTQTESWYQRLSMLFPFPTFYQPIDPSNKMSPLAPSDALQNCQIYFPKNHFIITSSFTVNSSPQSKASQMRSSWLGIQVSQHLHHLPTSPHNQTPHLPHTHWILSISVFQPFLSHWKPLLFAIWPKPG